MKTRKYDFIVWGTICHFWIDFTCACFVFQEIVGNKDWYTLLFLYNFYAFALELPMGTLLDGISEKNNGSAKGYFWTGIAGILLVILAGATALGKLSGGIVADLAGVKKAVVFSLGGGDLFRGRGDASGRWQGCSLVLPMLRRKSGNPGAGGGTDVFGIL